MTHFSWIATYVVYIVIEFAMVSLNAMFETQSMQGNMGHPLITI